MSTALIGVLFSIGNLMIGLLSGWYLSKSWHQSPSSVQIKSSERRHLPEEQSSDSLRTFKLWLREKEDIKDLRAFVYRPKFGEYHLISMGGDCFCIRVPDEKGKPVIVEADVRLINHYLEEDLGNV
jgi:hypothetical protein